MNDPKKSTLILIVGDVQKWTDLGRQLPKVANLVYCEYVDLTERFLDDLAPNFIFTPLVSRNFDLVDLAVLLHHLGYKGALRALIPALPNPQHILGEIMALCPNLDIDLIEVTPAPSPVLH